MKYLALIVVFVFMTSAAWAQAVCGKRSEFVIKLGKQYSEKPVGMGLAANGSMVEIFSSPAGTFSIVVTHPGGVSCLVAAGDNWAMKAPKKPVIEDGYI